jgi:large subunit ribosomal protein L1
MKRKVKFREKLLELLKLTPSTKAVTADVVTQKITALLNTVQAVPSKLPFETFEVAFHLNTDPKKTDQNIKTSVELAHGWPNKKKIAVFTNKAIILPANSTNITVGADTLIDQIKQEKEHKFDITVADLALEKKINPILRYLRSISPNKKQGTLVAEDQMSSVVNKLSNNELQLISTNAAVVCAQIGNTNMPVSQLVANFNRIAKAINLLKPTKLKLAMIDKASISTTQAHGSVTLTAREIMLAINSNTQ